MTGEQNIFQKLIEVYMFVIFFFPGEFTIHL